MFVNEFTAIHPKNLTIMNRDIPPLIEYLLKLIAKTPSKCLQNREICEKLLQASRRNDYFVNNPDIIQDIINSVIESGRMTDDAANPILFQGRSRIFLSNSRISGNFILYRLIVCSLSGKCFLFRKIHIGCD
jgi:hypothetical protein